MGLASIYRKYSLQGEGGREASKQISWIKDKLLHIYYQNSIDDRCVFPFVALKLEEKLKHLHEYQSMFSIPGWQVFKNVFALRC